MAVQPPFRTRGQEPVDHENAQDFLSVGVLTTNTQTLGEELVQLQHSPEFITHPTGFPLPWRLEPKRIQEDLNRTGGSRRWCSVRGKEGALPLVAYVFIKDSDGFLPRQALRIIGLT